jgi:hypothetical protein
LEARNPASDSPIKELFVTVPNGSTSRFEASAEIVRNSVEDTARNIERECRISKDWQLLSIHCADLGYPLYSLQNDKRMTWNNFHLAVLKHFLSISLNGFCTGSRTVHVKQKQTNSVALSPRANYTD